MTIEEFSETLQKFVDESKKAGILLEDIISELETLLADIEEERDEESSGNQDPEEEEEKESD